MLEFYKDWQNQDMPILLCPTYLNHGSIFHLQYAGGSTVHNHAKGEDDMDIFDKEFQNDDQQNLYGLPAKVERLFAVFSLLLR